jgi:NADPH2:quinone reductase
MGLVKNLNSSGPFFDGPSWSCFARSILFLYPKTKGQALRHQAGRRGGKEKNMKALVIVPGKEGGTLELRDLPKPEPKPGELQMRVRATALNRADLYQLKGTHPTQSRGSFTLAGLEAAGEVAALGENVSGFKVGDRIMAMCAGGYAEYVTLDARLAAPVPERLSWEEAATIPVAFMTEHNALITHAKLQPGESVLVHAASSGVGVAAIQIAKFFGAGKVLGTAGGPDKLEALASLGLDVGIDYRKDNFADLALASTKKSGVDVIIDHVGGPFLRDNLRCLAVKGRLISVGRLGGATAELDMEVLAYKRLQLIGVTFRTRTTEERIEIVQRFVADLIPPLTDGLLRPVIDRIFPLEQALAAQTYMVSKRKVGKIVLKVS